ncbi:unnamed protein product [Ilex paraguariensis]|uniref:Myb/SANT-like domain-containing protein n=1 Tax=Ilex paraguariensis TaxID=185542 RepID=A0ABC8RSR2_9AQUA
MASNSSSKGRGGANLAVQLEGSHIEQSTLNQSSIGENDQHLSDVSFDQVLSVTKWPNGYRGLRSYLLNSWLRNKYRTFKELLSTIGFGWDPETNIVTAEEDVWAQFIMTNPQAKCFCKKGCDHFNLLGLIFEKSIATGILARTSTQGPLTSNEERELEEEFMNGPFDPPPKKNVSTSSQKESKSSKIDNAIDAWIAFSIVRLEKYKCSGHNNHVDDPYSIEICMDVLEAIKDVDSQQYFRACAKFKDHEWRQMFLKMSVLRRKEWLDQIKCHFFCLIMYDTI